MNGKNRNHRQTKTTEKINASFIDWDPKSVCPEAVIEGQSDILFDLIAQKLFFHFQSDF